MRLQTHSGKLQRPSSWIGGHGTPHHDSEGTTKTQPAVLGGAITGQRGSYSHVPGTSAEPGWTRLSL